MKIHNFQNKENKQTKKYNNLKYFLFLFLNYIFNVREIFIYLMVICHFVEKKRKKKLSFKQKTQYLQFREHLGFFGFWIQDLRHAYLSLILFIVPMYIYIFIISITYYAGF